MIIDKYLIIFVHLSIIIKIKLYTTLSRLFNGKSITKLIKTFFQNILNINKKLNFYKIYNEKL